jgi:t-SNARE complex subunit (syntaxin)
MKENKDAKILKLETDNAELKQLLNASFGMVMEANDKMIKDAQERQRQYELKKAKTGRNISYAWYMLFATISIFIASLISHLLIVLVACNILLITSIVSFFFYFKECSELKK